MGNLVNKLKSLIGLAGGDDKGNSTTDNLAISGVFTGEWFDTINFASIIIGIKSDQDSAIDGLKIEWSSDGATAIQDDVFTISANRGKVYTFMPANRHYRIVYTNGLTETTLLDIQSILKATSIISSSHRIQDSIIGEDDATLNKAVLSGQDEFTGFFDNVKTFNGALTVTDGYVHKFGVDFLANRDVGNTTNPTNPITAGDRSFDVDDTTGLATDVWITITEAPLTEFSFMKILGVAGNTVTVHRPVDNSYTTAAIVKDVTFNLAVDGSGAGGVSFKIQPPAGVIWQITRLNFVMTHSSSGDDSKFGNIASLTNGALLGSSRAGGARTATTWFNNGDIRLEMYDITYSDKAGPGLYSTSGRWTFTKMGFILELDGDDSDFIEILIQDSLLTLTSFVIKAQGRIFGV